MIRLYKAILRPSIDFLDQLCTKMLAHMGSHKLYISVVHNWSGGRDSSVGIVTGYGLDGPGIESR
jgi:hypothetical protein